MGKKTVGEVSVLQLMAPDSHSVMLPFGSTMAGTRPLGLMSVNGFFLTSDISTILSSYGSPSSSSTMAVFQGSGCRGQFFPRSIKIDSILK